MMHREVQTSGSKTLAYTSTPSRVCSICDHCHHAPTRPGPARSAPARHTAQVGAVQAYLVHRSSGSSGVLMTGLLFVCVQNVGKTAYGCVP
jgi:hypothetical protein